MTHYDILGVEKTADADTIKKAYRKLAGKHHPDKGGDTKKFQEIQAAYQILSDENQRAQYDAELAGGGFRQFHFNTHNINPNDVEGAAIFEELRRQFGFGFQRGAGDPFTQYRQQARQAPRNRDVRIAIAMDLIDTLEPQKKTLSITLPGNKKENIELDIPRGVHNGTTIRYAGLGDHSIPSAPRADLYVQFQVRPHPKFGQAGIDLLVELTINCLEAITGCEKDVTGLDGRSFRIAIPPGTQYGSRFGIPDQGLYSVDHPGRGKLIVLLNIYIPKELNAEQLKTISLIQSLL